MTDRPLSDPDSPAGSPPFRPVCTAQISTAVHHGHVAASAPLYTAAASSRDATSGVSGSSSACSSSRRPSAWPAVAAGDGTVRHSAGHSLSSPCYVKARDVCAHTRRGQGLRRATPCREEGAPCGPDRVGCRSHLGDGCLHAHGLSVGADDSDGGGHTPDGPVCPGRFALPLPGLRREALHGRW